MSTLEKLFVQIFERKNWIIEEVQRQVDAYSEQLASRLLIDGITPPQSLLNHKLNSRSSDPHELTKEEIISKLLLPNPLNSDRYSTGGHSLYDKPVADRRNVQLSNEMSMEIHAPNKGLNVTTDPTKSLGIPKKDIGCSLNPVTEQDNSVNSPQNETDARISSIYAAPDSSLARIQRSKSRQKALELRNSGKTAAKSCLSKEDRTHISFPGDTTSQNDFHQVIQDKCSSEADKCKDHSKTSENEESDRKSSQQCGHADGVMEGVISLGSYEAKKSVTVKTHDTQRQSKPYSGRVTRSRASSQQHSRINKSLEFGTCAKEGRGALSYSAGDLKLGVDASNKVLDAVETSQENSDEIGETQAICSSKEVKKAVIPSNISASRVTSSRSGSMKKCSPVQENAEIVLGDVAVAVQPVDSGKKLDAVNMCIEPDGLALKQSSECCVPFKPKQLNFDEPDGCNSDKLSRKRKLDGLLGLECDPLTTEQHLPMENEVSSQSKSARTHSDEDYDVEGNDIGLNMNDNLMVEDGFLSEKRKPDECNSSSMDSDSSVDHKSNEQKLPMENVPLSKASTPQSHEDFNEGAKADVEHNSEHDGASIPCEVEERGFIPAPKPSLTKQGDMEVTPSLAKEVEAGINPKISNLKMNTWPRDPQRNVEDQTKRRFSDSHIQRDDLSLSISDDIHKVDESAFIAVPKPSFTSSLTTQGDIPSLGNELEAVKLSNLKQNTWPRDPQRNVEDKTNRRFSDSHIQRDAAIHCDFFDASEDDLYLPFKSDDIQKVTVAEVDDATLNQSEANAINLEKSEADYDDDVAVTDEMMPEYEGFTIHEELENGIDLETLKMPSNTIERISFIEQICKSAGTRTPFSQFSSAFHQNEAQDLYKFMSDELVEDVSEDFSKHVSESGCDLTEADYTFPNQQTFSGTPYNWQSKSYYASPVGKLWDRSASSSGSSSEKRLSSNPELTCFPIEEDPDSNEGSENEENINMKEAVNEENTVTKENDDDEVAVGIVAKVGEREAPPTGPMKYRERCSSNSVNVQANMPRTLDKVKYKSKFHPDNKSSKYEQENRTPSVSTRTSVRRNASIQTQNSKIMQSGIKRPLQREVKSNNIVSNVTSFVSVVQQKQAAAVAPVKRDIKVKALEAAEAAKRREEENEKERKMKKEALKIERAQAAKEKAKEMESNKKKKHEEVMKREADVAARKRQREEDEKKQAAKKRKIAEARKEQKLQPEKTRCGVKNAGTKKGSEKVAEIINKSDVIQQATTSVVAEMETNLLEKSPGQVGSTSQEASYDISPYLCSDDEDEDEDGDGLPNKKFVPSWASKRAVGMVLPLQQGIDPETIFPIGSFCSMDQVLLPRRLQWQ